MGFEHVPPSTRMRDDLLGISVDDKPDFDDEGVGIRRVISCPGGEYD